jgi:hypothetical protein
VNQNRPPSRLFFFAVSAAIILLPIFTFAQTAGKQVVRGSVPAALGKFNLQPLQELPATNQLRLAIGLPLRNKAALGLFLQQLQDPASTNYHHYLTPQEFTEQFGPTPADYDAVVNFAKAQGLSVTGTYSNRALVDVSADAGTVEKVFHVKMHSYRHPTENRNFFAPDTEPSIDLDVPILHIGGLDDFYIPRPALATKLNLSEARPASGSGPIGLLMGADFRNAYVPGVTLNGTGQTVGLFELDGYHANDITTYENDASLPHANVVNVYVDNYNGAAGNGNGEVALDIEMVVSMATNLNSVIVYEADNEPGGGEVIDVLNRIVTDDIAKQISSSWGIGDNPSFDVAYQQMAAQGQTFFQASGDNGAYYNGIPQWADDTNITLVGGTTLTMNGSGSSYASETVWNGFSTGEVELAGGGGVNFNGIPIPSYQVGINMIPVGGDNTLRNVPDVAMNADNIFIVADNGTREDVVGTSAAAPLWAGFLSLVNQQAVSSGISTMGFINPAIYALGKSANYTANFHDITVGNNTNLTVANKYFAAAGYDLCTGFGTPIGPAMIKSLAPLSLVIQPAAGYNVSGPAGGPFTPGSGTFHLINDGTNALSWSLTNVPPWLTASATNGTLPIGVTNSIQLTINAAADALPIGSYSATLLFSNANAQTVQSRSFSLLVFDSLSITPLTGFLSAGATNGPFSPGSTNFLLINASTNVLSWSLLDLPSWLAASATNGTVPDSGTDSVQIAFSAAADALSAGDYSATILFSNANAQTVQSRSFLLLVYEPGAPLIQNGGFETGDFTDWTLNGNSFVNVVSGPYTYNSGSSSKPFFTTVNPHSGNYQAIFGQPYSEAFLSQIIPTIPGQLYNLSLWMNSPDGLKTNEFSVAWNDNTIYDRVNLPKSGWTQLTFVVAATANISTLEIGGRDDPTLMALDDVNLVPIPSVELQTALGTTANGFTFSWNALTNLTYQVQSATNLSQPTWITVQTIKPTMSPVIFTGTNSAGGSPQTFYRLLVLP